MREGFSRGALGPAPQPWNGKGCIFTLPAIWVFLAIRILAFVVLMPTLLGTAEF